MVKRIILTLGLIPAVVMAQTGADTSWRSGDRMAGTKGTSPQGEAIIQKVTNVDASGTPTSGPTTATQGSTTSGQSGTLSMCAVVTGDQAYTTGTTRPLNCIPTGRLKVAVSNAGNVDPATQLATTLTADLTACKYYSTPATWLDGYTGSVQCDNGGRLKTFTTLGVRIAAVDAEPNSYTLDTYASDQVSARLLTRGQVFNGSTWDRQRGDAIGTYVVMKGTTNLGTTQVSVGTTATQIVAARTGRSRLIITQSAAGPCYYSSSATVSATTGARLTAAGASKTLQYAGVYYGICPGGAVTVDTDEEY